jgi:uncharacterized protein (TIGR01777 family)
MKVAISGGSGFIGSRLIESFRAEGHEVVALTRSPRDSGSGVKWVRWSPPAIEDGWLGAIAGVDAVINLAGESIAAKAWSDRRRQAILSSRVDSTTALAGAIAQLDRSPTVFVSGSAVGYYGSRGDQKLTEVSAPGDDFLADVCRQWEAAAQPAESHTRVVYLRTAVVLGPGGGALPQMARPFRLFFGGQVGPRDQYFSWIHIDDEIGLILTVLEDASISGPVNASSPNPVLMPELAGALGRSLHRPVWLPGVPMVMKLVLGQRSEFLFASLRVIPEKARDAGFDFKHPILDEALNSALSGR